MVAATAREIDVNHPISIAATIYLSVIGAAVFIVQPGFVQGLSRCWDSMNSKLDMSLLSR